MTLTLKLNLDMVKMYHHTKMKFLRQLFPELQSEQKDRHTDTDTTKTLPLPHTRGGNDGNYDGKST